MLFKIALAGALSALSVVGVTSQSCVMLINDTTTSLSLTSDPCDEAALEFTLEGVTLVAENTVSVDFAALITHTPRLRKRGVEVTRLAWRESVAFFDS